MRLTGECSSLPCSRARASSWRRAQQDSTGSRASGGVHQTTASQSSSADVIDVSSGSKMSLALRGGIGPIVSGQTITKATVTISDLELVDANGGSVVLSSNGFRGDLVALQNQLGQLFSQQSVQAGRYTAMRFRLRSAWVEAQDVNGALTVYASQDVDRVSSPGTRACGRSSSRASTRTAS